MLGSLHAPIITLALFICVCASAQEDVEKKAQEISTKLVNIQHNWGLKMSTPGVSLVLKETGRGEMNGQGYVGFHLFETGLPNDHSYKVQSLLINLQAQELMDGTFNQDGMAICAGTAGHCVGDKPNDDIEFRLSALPGEPLRIAVISDEGDYKAFISDVPFPISASDKGCTVQSIRLLPNNELILVQGDHFPVNADLQMISSNEGETLNRPVKSDPDGHFDLAVMTGVKGKDHGTDKMTLSASACSPTLKVHWGKGTSNQR